MQTGVLSDEDGDLIEAAETLLHERFDPERIAALRPSGRRRDASTPELTWFRRWG